MRFFTKSQLKGIACYSFGALVVTGLFTMVSTMIGVQVGNDAADDYASANNCSNAYNFWNQRPNLNASEACHACKDVCETANNLATDTVTTFTLWPLGLGTFLTIIALVGLATRVLYVNNKEERETDRLINTYKEQGNLSL